MRAQTKSPRAIRRPRPPKRRSAWGHVAMALLVVVVAGAVAIFIGTQQDQSAAPTTTVAGNKTQAVKSPPEAPASVVAKAAEPRVDAASAADVLLTEPDYGILYREIKRQEPAVFQNLQNIVARALANGADVDTAKLSAEMQVETILRKFWSNASDPVVFQRLIVDAKLYDLFARVKPSVCVNLWNARPIGSDAQLIPNPLQEQIISMQVGLLQDYSDNKRPGLSNERTAAAAGIVWKHVAQLTGRDLSIVTDLKKQNEDPAALCHVASTFNTSVRTQLNHEFVAPLIRQLTRAMLKDT
jgi:hypothetical protein